MARPRGPHAWMHGPRRRGRGGLSPSRVSAPRGARGLGLSPLGPRGGVARLARRQNNSNCGVSPHSCTHRHTLKTHTHHTTCVNSTTRHAQSESEKEHAIVSFFVRARYAYVTSSLFCSGYLFPSPQCGAQSEENSACRPRPYGRGATDQGGVNAARQRRPNARQRTGLAMLRRGGSILASIQNSV